MKGEPNEVILEMLMATIISLLIGIALGQRFKVMVLIPVIGLTLVLASAAAIAHPDSNWVIAKTAAVAAAGLQVGYLLGLGVRHLTVLARASRLRAASLSSSLPPRRSAH